LFLVKLVFTLKFSFSSSSWHWILLFNCLKRKRKDRYFLRYQTNKNDNTDETSISLLLMLKAGFRFLILSGAMIDLTKMFVCMRVCVCVCVFFCLSPPFRTVKMLRFSSDSIFSNRKVDLVGTLVDQLLYLRIE